MKDKFLNLRVAMTKAQLSVNDIAKEMGISPQALYSKLNCRTNFTLSDIKQIKEILAKKLGDQISLETLFGDDNDS